MNSLTPVQSRRLALAILVALVLSVYLTIVQPIRGQHHAYEERIAELNHRLERYQRVVQKGSENEKILAELKRRRPALDYYLKATKAPLASAELQQHVERVIRTSGARLISTQVVSSEETAPFPRVTIKAHLQGDIESLRSVIYTFEAGKPVLFLDNVFITVFPTRMVPGVRQGDAAAPLDVHLDVIGYRQGGKD